MTEISTTAQALGEWYQALLQILTIVKGFMSYFELMEE